MPFEKINNLNIYYEVHGEGEPVILMHHGFGCTKIWKNVYPIIAGQGYKVVVFDRRGFGRSEDGDDFQEFYLSGRYRSESIEELRTIKERLGIAECHLVGQCEGGVMGIDYAAAYPEEVITLTVASTQCYSKVPMVELNAGSPVKDFRLLNPGLMAKMIDWHGKAAEARYNMFAGHGGAYTRGYFDIRPVLPSVTCPTLVLYPDRSAVFDVEQAVAFYRHLPKGELAIFPKCGHNTYDQRPDDYARTLLDFITRSKGKENRKASPTMSCLA